jgi:NhaA family Na+:H+ antiporter
MGKKKYPIDRIIYPVQQFMQQEKAGGIVLVISLILALVIANSPWSEHYFHILEYKLGFQFNGKSYLEYDILHWINDGLMAIFFFVIGLELKREFISGELSAPRKALLPIIAALGGMLVPAVIYFSLNPTGDMSRGWGIPMATDIAFSLGVLSVLGKRVPFALKVFLTALAVVDDLGAIVVIALFYSSGVSIVNLSIGLGFALIMFIGNKMGIKNIIFYALFGILGVWVAFLLSGVHATIAAVIAAFMIPSDIKIEKEDYINKIKYYLDRLKTVDRDSHYSTLTDKQLQQLEGVKERTNSVIPPLQRLEYTMHPFVTFFVLPVFALANAGVVFDMDIHQLFSTNVTIGVALGLLFGKVIGVTGATLLSIKLKITLPPKGMTFSNLIGIGFLASIGFTMSLFVTSLAFTNPGYTAQAKIGIFVASTIGAIIGYIVLNKTYKKSLKGKEN